MPFHFGESGSCQVTHTRSPSPKVIKYQLISFGFDFAPWAVFTEDAQVNANKSSLHNIALNATEINEESSGNTPRQLVHHLVTAFRTLLATDSLKQMKKFNPA